MSQAFIIDSNPSIWWPVSVSVPRPQGPVTQQFKAKIAVLSEEAFEELFAPQADDVPAAEQALKDILARNARILPKLILDWDVKNTVGEIISISELPGHLTGPYGRALSIGLNRAINEIRYGLPSNDNADDEPTEGANVGNSERSPDAG